MNAHKQNVLYTYDGALLGHKTEWSTDTCVETRDHADELQKHVGFHLCEISRKGKPTETENKLEVARDRKNRRNCLLGNEVFFGLMKLFWNQSKALVMWFHTCAKWRWTVQSRTQVSKWRESRICPWLSHSQGQWGSKTWGGLSCLAVKSASHTPRITLRTSEICFQQFFFSYFLWALRWCCLSNTLLGTTDSTKGILTILPAEGLTSNEGNIGQR